MRRWIDLYHAATQRQPFRTLREIQVDILMRVLRGLGVGGDATPYVDLFFQVTTKVELYPEALEVLNGLGPVRSAIVSNADFEHLAAWSFKWPVQHIVISEAVRAYKPHPLLFQRAVEQLGLRPHDVLHVGDSEIDDVGGARAAGLRVAWINRAGRSRRIDVPAPDYQIRDLTELGKIVRRQEACRRS
jgi:2-haloalkanoic acid dehalogenase type II